MSDHEPMPWEGTLIMAAGTFGEECAKLRDTNPYASVELCPPLDRVITYLMTELWDQNFSVSEIKQAFEAAIKDLPRYANGWERRSDERGTGWSLPPDRRN